MARNNLPQESAELLERVKQAKLLNHLSHERIAREADMRTATVCNQFNGYYNLDIRVVLAIARLCPNVSAEYLLRGQGDIVHHPATPPDYTALLERLNNMEKQVNNIAKT